MNAYELVNDYKENWDSFDEVDAFRWIEKALPMLRQQAERIEELEIMLQIHNSMNSHINELMKETKERHGIK